MSVAIAVSSPHRAESYEASRYVIEEIKKRLPVWKKERYSEGDESWVEGHVPAGGELQTFDVIYRRLKFLLGLVFSFES